MMRRRWKLWLSLVVLLGGMAALPAVHWRLFGWARGEAFYQGRPTTWWRGECRSLKPRTLRSRGEGSEAVISFDWSFETSWLLVQLNPLLGPFEPQPFCSPVLIDHNGDPDALPVLIELLRDSDRNVLLVAVSGFKDFGPEAREAVPALLALTRINENDWVDVVARQALDRIDPEAAKQAGSK